MITHGTEVKPFRSLRKNVLAACLFCPVLHENSQHMAVLIHGALQVMPFSLNRQKHLIQMPLVTWSGTLAPSFIRIRLAALAPPFADGFVDHNHPMGEHQLVNMPVAQAE
jgi:hypothetical protein